MEKMLSVKGSQFSHVRNFYGLAIQDVSDNIKIDVDDIRSFEEGRDFPSYAQLSKIADFYNKPLFFFFTTESLTDTHLEGAFRSVKNDSANVSRKTKLMLEKAEIYRLNLQEMYDVNDLKLSNFKKMVEKEKPSKENFPYWLREKIGMPLDEQKKHRSSEKLLKEVRNHLYDMGIYIFKDSFKDDNVSGLCLYDDKFPVILLNNKNTFGRQLFTVFHEVYHLYIDEKNAHVEFCGNSMSEEEKCNDFASKFLIPEKDFNETIASYKNFDKSVIYDLARTYSVSLDAIAYRLFKEDKVTRNFYEEFHDSAIRKGGAKSGGNFYNTKISYLGDPYLSKVFSMYYSEKIDISKVSDYVGLKVRHVPRLASAKFGGAF